MIILYNCAARDHKKEGRRFGEGCEVGEEMGRERLLAICGSAFGVVQGQA